MVQPSPQTPLPERERGFELYLMSLGIAISNFKTLGEPLPWTVTPQITITHLKQQPR
jgi:hypothetical protein